MFIYPIIILFGCGSLLLDRHVAPAVKSLMTCSDWKFPLATRGRDYEVIGLLFNTDPGVTILWCVCVWQFLLYCEGTRFTEQKHQISMQVAESKGLPKLKYHLLPRTKGFTTTLQCLKGTGQINVSTHSIAVLNCCVTLLKEANVAS